MIFFSGKSNNVEINWLQSSSDKNSSFSSRIAPLWGRHCLELEMVKPWQTNWFPGFVATIDLSELRQLFQDKVSAFRNWSSNILPTEHGYKHGDEVVTFHSQICLNSVSVISKVFSILPLSLRIFPKLSQFVLYPSLIYLLKNGIWKLKYSVLLS